MESVVAFTLERLRNWFLDHLRKTDSDLNGIILYSIQSNEMKERKRLNTSSRNVSLAEDGRVSTSVSLMLRSRPVRFVAPGSFIRASRKEILAPRVPNSSNPARINSP